jgi:hypothetical protein
MTDADPITEALRRAKAVWAADGFPAAAAGNPGAPEVGTVKSPRHQSLETQVPSVPTVPTPREKGRVRTSLAEVMANWEERAAILEYDGGWPRAEAERRASDELCQTLEPRASPPPPT